MNNCQRCGEQLREGTRFCIGCGAPVAAMAPLAAPGPVSHRPEGRALAMIALGALGVALVITATLLVVQRSPAIDGTAGAAPREYADVPAPAIRSVTATVTPGGPPTSTTTVTPAAGDSSIRADLDAEVSADRYGVEALVGYWVPQVSAKQPGMVVHGVSFGYREVWQDFRDTRERYPEALLLRSGDFPVYKLAGFWVTVVPETFDSGASANAWCDAAGFAAEDCYAKRLVHSGASQENTLFRQ